MYSKHLILSAILWTIFFAQTVSGDISKDSTLCGRMTCNVPAERKFKYNESLYYQYQYKVDVSTNLGDQGQDTTSDESSQYIDATVTLYFTTPCEGYLKLSNASISHDRSRYHPEFPDRAGGEFKAGLERYVLRFAFDDGVIREVCPDPKESVWALNLKRGILSMLQNSMMRFDVDRRVDELDVNGICETRYKLHEAKKTSLVIRKTKHLASCTHSSKHLSIIQSQTYRSPLSQSRISRQPLLKSQSECEITIDHNIYERVVCNDSHQLQPLSNGKKAGVRTDMSASLELISETMEISMDISTTDNDDDDDNDNEESNVSKKEDNETSRESMRLHKEAEQIHAKRTTLLYDHAKAPRTIHGELRTSRDLLKNMCRHEAAEEVQQSFSELFTKFIHSARMLDYPSLSQMFARANSICKNSRKHIINALPYIGSNAGVCVMKDLIINKYISQETLQTWVTAFALIPQPDRKTIKSLAPLLDFQQEMPNAQFILSYSAIIHTYCSTESSCLQLEPITQFLSYVENKIEKGCVPRSQSLSTIKETLEALKAIGNMGVETESLVGKLRVCIADSGGFLPMEVRVAAIDAHRRLQSCQKTRDQFFLNLYRNFTIDPEIRIASYLQVMRCPDYRVIKTIRQTLEEEEVNQVGSFVWSHLKNLLSSSSPTRVEIQSLLTDRDLGSKFNSDLRKFSRNYDNSFFSEEYNFGANYQGNLIFSSKSYVPRQATLNLTIDLFGESVNLFEVDVRMEGLEFYAESMFGPSGPFSGEKMGNHFKQFLRQFRSAPEEDEDYWKRVKRLPNVIDNNFDHPRISLGYRVFGNELKFTMLDGDQEIKNAVATLNPWAKVKQILSGKEIHYENTAMLLDSSYVIPTTSGLPIRLDLAGSAACNFKLSGLLDSKRLSSGEFEVIGSIVPSVSLDITGSMTTDAFYKSAGIKLRTNVYSSGAVEAHLNVKGPRLVRLGLSLPNRKMEIFSMHSDVLIVKTNGAEVNEKAIGLIIAEQDQNKMDQSNLIGNVISNTTCSWPSLDRLFGLKICADYQFPNVTKNPKAAYFILNGPTLFKVSVVKADPSAKSYILEYKMERTANESFARVAFDTPGSQMKRELSATISFNVHSNNVTLTLQSASNSFVAKGTYKRTDNETFLDVGLDINGTKHLDASVGYSIKKVNYGYTYTPKWYLAINSERIAELSGMIRNQQKNNVSQCDIDLTFQTKKVWSRILGYIMKRNISLSGNVKIDYQLQKMPKKETLQLEISLINRSTKTLNYKAANVKLHSTAYPQLNTVISSWYQQAMGHLELHAEVNSSPHLQDDRHKLVAQLVITYSKGYFQSQGAKISAFVALTKPIQNLDIKLGINHYAIGDESKTTLLVRYAPGKEIVLTFNMIVPRGTMFAIEGHANLTIPNFNSMLISARITERSRNEYDLDFSGTWFSGHNMTVRGIYSDRSTISITNHNFKLLVKSPSFVREIILNCKFYYDVTNLRIGLFMEQMDMDKYALILNHTALSLGRLSTFIEGRYKNNIYSVLTKIDTNREIRVEMHLDRWRDVHLIGTAINEPSNKELGFEVKWDANRDPALKFATSIQLNKNVPCIDADDHSNQKNMTVLITITYPGRLVTGSCLFALRDVNNYVINARLSWDSDKTVELTVDADYIWLESLKFESQLLTPFENWKKTSLNAKFLQMVAKLTLSGSAYWQDSQHVLVDLLADAKEHPEILEWNANFGLSSTVHSIIWVTANLTHKQLFARGADSRLLVKYHPDKVIDVRSIWQLHRASDGTFNLTGNLLLVSPLVNYRKGEMKCLLSAMPNWKFLGAANIDLDKRKYTANMIGNLAQLRESMIQFNITTPLERYAYIRGRFGLSEKDRHVVAEVISPAGPLGFEAIFQILTSSYDFNIKLLIATPIDALEKALLVAKLNSQEADFRVAYNNITAGFEGVWYYETITDFHYTYILYTPIHGLHEIGIITKLVVIHTEPDGYLDIDTEFSLRLVELKAGVKAKCGPKPPPVRIPLGTVMKTNSQVEGESGQLLDPDEEYKEEEEDDENLLYWRGETEINAVIVEPITILLDIDKEGPKYKIGTVLKLPQGRITLDDSFIMEDFFNIKNDLSIETPFKSASEINSVYIFRLQDSKVLMQMELNVQNYSSWVESGFSVNYTSQKGVVDVLKIHSLQLNFKTPLQFLKYVDTTTIVEMDENDYKASVIVKAEGCLVNLAGLLEMEESYLDVAITADVNSSVLTVPKTKITAKKDFTDKERLIEFGITTDKLVGKSANFKASWHVEDQHFLKVSIVLETWIEVIKAVEIGILYNDTMKKNSISKLNLSLKHQPNQEYQFVGEFKNGTVKADLHSPLAMRHLQFQGVLIQISENHYKLEGDLQTAQTDTIYKILSFITMEKDELSTVEINATPSNNAMDDNKYVVNVIRENYGINVQIKSHALNGNLSMSCTNALNWNLRSKIETLNNIDKYDIYKFNTFMNVQVNGNTTVYAYASTPWQDLECAMLNGNLLLSDDGGCVRLNHHLNRDDGFVLFEWKLSYLTDMFGKILANHRIDGINNKNIDVQLFFKNPKRAFKNVNIGFDVNIDQERWRIATNATVGILDDENVDVIISSRLPPPDNDDHRFLISYHANKGIQDANYVIGYNALRAKTNYASDGSMKMAARNIDGHLRLTWGTLPTQTMNNVLNATFDNKGMEFKYSLYTPKYLQEETMVLLFLYDAAHDVHTDISADLFLPAHKQVGSTRISYVSLVNVNGTINATTPVSTFAYVGCDFVVLTTLKQNKRLIKAFWPNNTALLDSDYTYHSERLDSTLDGHLHMEVPLSTRHVGHLTYGYKKRPQITNGYSKLLYNNQEILNGQYKSKSESRGGFEKDEIKITIENIFKPVGIVYINQFEYSGGNEGTNYPTTEFKKVNVFRLDNSTAFNVIGESRVHTTHDGQEVYLKAVHFNRTVQLRTDYKILPGEFDQNTWLSLAEDAWASYHINILNKTTEDVENQFLVLGLVYPRRNFTLNGSYLVTSSELNSEAHLIWNHDQSSSRTLGSSFLWKNISSSGKTFQQLGILSLKHPSFQKDVTFTGQVINRDDRELLNAAFLVDYSIDTHKLLNVSATLRDESNLPIFRKFTYAITGNHAGINLHLDIQGYIHQHSPILLETENTVVYRRGNSEEETGQLLSRIDISKNQILVHRENTDSEHPSGMNIKYLNMTYNGSYPEYTMKGSVINSPDLNATGAFFLNFVDKLTWTMVNYTPDAVESLRMYGNIPDARNAAFDIWRTYDQELTVSDVTFYLRLNHSRLVTSTLRWRPELRADVISTIKTTMTNIYDQMSNDVDYWRHTVRSETVNVISQVWENAQDELHDFLYDWNELKIVEQDFQALKVYLNNSYNANDFYIRDVVALGIYIIDELSLRSHIQSLPNILNEIWEIMGESGEALRNSLLWIIEAVKNAYQKLSEIISAILNGESVSQIAHIVEKLIEKYDMFIKDLHVSFIKYIENLWNRISHSISQQWHKFLKLLEPMFIRVIHYLETVVWKASKEVVDFLYDRRNEIITSPYFDRFTNFTQDIDKFYRDIKANDIITNIQKYSTLVIQFIQERYFTFVPFGKELKDVVDEIITELKELRKLPSVYYALDKMHQVYAKMNELYEYFQVRAKLETTIRLIHSKLMDISQTALQAESRYREAKTKFIFDPNRGLMCYEQKLPMSWHAFNQTPEFQEIPEYRAITDMGSYFVTSNATFWTLYYQFKPYTEPSNWLPPFKAQAMIAGSQYFVTFDGHFIQFAGNCTYLLARDFLRDEFAVLAKYNQDEKTPHHQIIVLIGKKPIIVDLFKDTVILANTDVTLQLPIELENGIAFVYQEESIVVVERKDKQFKLHCNLKYDLCTLELSGWYFGKTAGLLGTMNNEQVDDQTTSDKYIETDVGKFAHSWALDREQCNSEANRAISRDDGPASFCQDLFVNRSSDFGACFNVVSPDHYGEICLNSVNEMEACTVAMTYMQACMFYDTYLRIPDKCTTCSMNDGSQVPEGEFSKLEGASIPRATDVVFIVEAKECNRGIRSNRNLDHLITQINKELVEQNLIDNRWSLVTFGGDGVYDQPRSLILDSQIFAKNTLRFIDYFDRVPVGNGNQDAFAAIGFASQLVFRPGVSKTFILMPCTHCELQNQSLDYSVLHQVLLEHDITLHILMDGDFQFEKGRLSKIFYGLDASKSYTKKDSRTLLGDVDLRKQVKLPKSALGYCTPLSLESNGTIFSGNKLRFGKVASIKKFASVFAKRVAISAGPNPCQHCECISDNDGITKMECMPCVYPTPVTVDYANETFDEDEALSALQPVHMEYDQTEVDED